MFGDFFQVRKLTLVFCVVLLIIYVCEGKFGSKGDGISSLSSYGSHGGLHPSNKDQGNVNSHKLELFFDDDCDLEEGTVFVSKIYTSKYCLSLSCHNVCVLCFDYNYIRNIILH